jgi:hypothetical protein
MFANTDLFAYYGTGLLTGQLSLLVRSYCTPLGPICRMYIRYHYYSCICNEFNSVCSIVKKKPVTFFAVWVVCWLILVI